LKTEFDIALNTMKLKLASGLDQTGLDYNIISSLPDGYAYLFLQIHYATKLSQQNFSSKFCHFSNAHNSVNFHRIKTIFFFIL